MHSNEDPAQIKKKKDLLPNLSIIIQSVWLLLLLLLLFYTVPIVTVIIIIIIFLIDENCWKSEN